MQIIMHAVHQVNADWKDNIVIYVQSASSCTFLYIKLMQESKFLYMHKSFLPMHPGLYTYTNASNFVHANNSSCRNFDQ